MSRMNLMKMAAAMALLFAVNMNANAQFGKLKSLTKKAKEAVTEKVATVSTSEVSTSEEEVTNPVVESNDQPAKTQQSSSASTDDGMPKQNAGESDEAYRKRLRRYWDKDQPQKLEQYDVEDAGGLQQYLGLTQGDELLFWKYYNKELPLYASDGNGTFNRLIEVMRINKNPYYDSYSGQKNYFVDNRKDLASRFGYVDAQGKLQGNIAKFLQKATGKDPKYKVSKPIPAADGKTIERVAIKALKAFEAKYGRVEP